MAIGTSNDNRHESRPPVPPMSGDAGKPAPKAPAAPKATKVAKPASRKPVAARTNAKGAVLRCSVKLGSSQCANPGRHPHGRGFTCTTHDKAIAKGARLTILAKATAVYVAPRKTA